MKSLGSFELPQAGIVDQRHYSAEFDGVKRDPVSSIVAEFDQIAGRTPEVAVSFLGGPGRLASQGGLPRYIFLGPSGGGDPVHIGIFAGIHGDEPAGAHAVARLLRRLADRPGLATGYRLFLYPVCNPSGLSAGTRTSASGKDLNREFWKGSAEPEVILLEREIRQHRFQGLISLHSDDTSDGVYGFVRGAVLTRALLEPALAAAERVLARNDSPVIDGFPAERGIISRCYDGILTSPPELEPLPFEIIIETPQRAVVERQEEAFVAAVEEVLLQYQNLLAFAPNL